MTPGELRQVLPRAAIQQEMELSVASLILCTQALNPNVKSTSMGSSSGEFFVLVSWDKERSHVLEQAVQQITAAEGKDVVVDVLRQHIEQLSALLKVSMFEHCAICQVKPDVLIANGIVPLCAACDSALDRVEPVQRNELYERLAIPVRAARKAIDEAAEAMAQG